MKVVNKEDIAGLKNKKITGPETEVSGSGLQASGQEVGDGSGKWAHCRDLGCAVPLEIGETSQPTNHQTLLTVAEGCMYY